jgi:hypothetical protein
MYSHIGKWCTDSYYSFVGLATGEIIDNPTGPNCTDAVIIIDPQIQTVRPPNPNRETPNPKS